MGKDWWRQAVVYQIYPRSFADSNGDGTGDLVGITSRIPYLRALGVDAIWLSPFYPSALADGGYDVDDYRDVDPAIGTLSDFDELVTAVHTAGMKIVVDIVPNHSSDRHIRFRQAIAGGRGSAERDMYIFRDGLGDGSLPPSDWQSMFGGPAWTRVNEPDGKPGQWYLHTFAREQPDWNWSNPAVRADFLETLRFWGDRGVDGFRIDVAHYLSKDLPEVLPDHQQLNTPGAYPDGLHPTVDRDDVHEIYAEWRALFDTYDPPLAAVAEAWVPPHRRVHYARSESLGQAFNFDLLEAVWDRNQFATIIADNLELARQSGASSTWVLSNHDVVRHATRYGLEDDRSRGRDWLLTGGTTPPEDRSLGIRRARAVTLLVLALPGSAYIYQGEELGLPEVAEMPLTARQDPTFHRSNGTDVGRDGCRVPLPWTSSGASFGFGTGAAHLPQPSWFADYAVEVQERTSESTLRFYRQALRLRSSLQNTEELHWLDLGPDVIAFRRPGGWVSITNFGTTDISAPDGEHLISSTGTPSATIAPDVTAWLRTGPRDE
ncbi:glycoside hydrolase family 13 protein [Rhodococcus sp. 14-2470-1a]|uniref:glycoside hydrolase family 13 protein n=1 Tax=Rhodococcus sp. 14-2470-1a TaxID=2023150 RepID=UPI001C5273DB|nr:glycoside hydrolase family 13 protein [Rhodococcus sp. 14-2470-1a]